MNEPLLSTLAKVHAVQAFPILWFEETTEVLNQTEFDNRDEIDDMVTKYKNTKQPKLSTHSFGCTYVMKPLQGARE